MDTVYRYTENEFTGVPIAKLHKGIWYWPTYEDAYTFAKAYALPADQIRIVTYQKGWAIQMRQGGPYVEAPKSQEDRSMTQADKEFRERMDTLAMRQIHEGEARDRLNAAAPDMLEALKEIEDLYQDDAIEPPHGPTAASSAWQKVRAAIAKAEGRS